MKILHFVLCVALGLGLLCGCRPLGRTTEDYRRCAFFAEVRFECGGVTVYAEAESALTDGRATLATVRLMAPPTLAGITLVREGENVTVMRDGLCMTASGARGWWDAVNLLCAEGTLSYVCDTELEGLALEYAEIACASGETVEVFRERGTGIPKRICKGERTLTVIRFATVEARENT